jgi:hypothetical protein
LLHYLDGRALGPPHVREPAHSSTRTYSTTTSTASSMVEEPLRKAAQNDVVKSWSSAIRLRLASTTTMPNMPVDLDLSPVSLIGQLSNSEWSETLNKLLQT